MKNPTLREIAFITSGGISLLAAIFLFIAYLIPSVDLNAWLILLLPLMIFGLGYYLVYQVVEKFVYRKIKLIYKSIHASKTGKDYLKDKIDSSENILDDVEKDVSKYATEKNKEIEELKKLEEYRREFLGNVSHELKTPIFNAQGYLDTLIHGGMNDDRILSDYLHKAYRNLDRLSKVVEELLLINQYESGKLKLDLERFDIHELIKEVIDNFEMTADNRDIHLGIKKGMDNLSFVVEADRDMISQVLNNLISNSIKYGKDGGKTLVGFYDMHDYILVEITDDGVGIEEEHLPRLFERFYRIDKHRSREGGGTGLGLAIVKHIIEAHDQTINVRSTVGRGSTFGFTLKKA